METIKILFEELDLPYYINEALWIKIREYNRKYFTMESLELMFSYFQETEYASKLINEYFAIEPGMFQDKNLMVGSLYDELDYVNNRNIKFAQKIDLLV